MIPYLKKEIDAFKTWLNKISLPFKLDLINSCPN